MIKKALLVIVGLFVLFIVIGIVTGPSPSSSTSSSVRALLGEGQTTMAQYTKLRDGMSYADAVTILGRPGEEMSSNNIAGMRTVMYMWSNPGGANMNAMFQNDAMVQKSQFGLK